MRFVNAALLSVAVAALAACAAQPIAPEKLTAIKTVVTTVGNDVEFQRVGYMAFGNGLKSIDISELKIAGFFVERLRKLLGGRYVVKQVAYDAKTFPQDVIWDRSDASPLSDAKPGGEVIRSHVSPQGLDAYIVVVPYFDGFGTTNQRIEGFGIV